MDEYTIIWHLNNSSDSRSWKYKNDWVEQVLAIARQHNSYFEGFTVLEMGAGVHNPLGCALVFLSCGSSRAIAVEPGVLLSEHLTHALTVGLLSSFHYGVEREYLRHALNGLIAHSGDVGRDDNNIDFKSLKLLNCPLEMIDRSERFDIIHSNAVLEHVQNISNVCDVLFEITRPGGIHIHKVDFLDHRYYELESPNACDAYRFLLVGEEGAKTDCNRLRMSDIINTFQSAGFQSLGAHQKWEIIFPEEEKARLQPRYRSSSPQDLNTSCAILVFRKP